MEHLSGVCSQILCQYMVTFQHRIILCLIFCGAHLCWYMTFPMSRKNPVW